MVAPSQTVSEDNEVTLMPVAPRERSAKWCVKWCVSAEHPQTVPGVAIFEGVRLSAKKRKRREGGKEGGEGSSSTLGTCPAT